VLTREWRGLHNKGLYDLYCLTNIVQVIKPRRMRWAEQVNMRESCHLEHLGMDGIILKCIFNK
jgi:hypothetical protein